MSNTLYIAAAEARSGKSLISLGVMEILMRKVERVGFFRPFINVEPGANVPDNDINLMARHYKLETPYEEMYGYTMTEAKNLLSLGAESELIEGILRKFNHLQETYDFVLCEGTDFKGSSMALEFDINAEIAKNLASPVLLVASAQQKNPEETVRTIDLTIDTFSAKACEVVSTIVNHVKPEDAGEIVRLLGERNLLKQQLVYTLPYESALGSPTVGEIADILKADVLYGHEQLYRHVHNYTVAAMQLRNFLTRIERGSLIITPGDRADVIVASLAAAMSHSTPTISGIVLTGGLLPEEPIWELIKGFPPIVPILSVKENTFPTARIVDGIHATITPDNDRKITRALALFEKHVDVEKLAEKVIATKSTIVTPKMFEYGLLQKARTDKQHIVLPEGEDTRILRAAETLLRREVVDITFLGREVMIRDKIDQMGLRLNGAKIISPETSELFDDYAQTYYDLRKRKGITPENARDIMSDVNYFGTMMVYKGHADGMVSGALHTTGATIRPAFEFIKTKPGFSIVSSVFFMCLEHQVLVYGDCAVNPNPTANQLAEIAISSAQTARTFGVEPRVAMLSYSTGASGAGEDVDRVREATKLARELASKSWPDLKIEGPIQYDAAVDAAVAKTKMPDSEVAGKATVFIFPDLNTGNNTYKAVQRSSGAVAIGPVLQGLNRPVNDLSRGCTIPDIVNTVAITAIQAQSAKSMS